MEEAHRRRKEAEESADKKAEAVESAGGRVRHEAEEPSDS